MKLEFKTQAFQTAGVRAVVDYFAGQPPTIPAAVRNGVAPGRRSGQSAGLLEYFSSDVGIGAVMVNAQALTSFSKDNGSPGRQGIGQPCRHPSFAAVQSVRRAGGWCILPA